MEIIFLLLSGRLTPATGCKSLTDMLPRVKASRGMSWFGMAGLARRGLAWRGMARRVVARHGRLGAARPG